MKKLDDAAATLRGRDIIVAYSDGKDSRAVMALAKKHARKVHAFYQELIPLDFMTKRIQAAESYWGIEILRVRHWSYYSARAEGTFCFSNDMPKVTETQLFDWLRSKFHCQTVATGIRRTDSLYRATTFRQVLKRGDRYCAPIYYWSTKDVVDYLSIEGIGCPESEKSDGSGINLDDMFIRWLARRHPQDYKQLEASFPFVGAAVMREALK